MAWIDRRPGVRPRATVGRRLDMVARVSFPTGSTILLLMLMQAPLGITGQAAMLPAVALCCVWFWSLTQPQYLPPSCVFLIGLLLDLLAYLPFGVGTLTLLCCHGIAVALRRFLAPRGFTVIWLAFIPLAAAAALLMWLLVMLLMVRFFSPTPAVFQAVVTAALYPALAVPLAAAQRAITSPERL